MIKPEDLKKNNYAIPKYSNKNDEFVQLTAYDISQIEAGNYHFEPIPLNEQWLIDLGFEVELVEYRIDSFTIKKDFTINSMGHWRKELKYVHQLQNLYHALTGKELIKQEPRS